ncbi:MAG TPA: hypothetical protein VNA20_06300 [Frankiaceae bacterium]|nr:hypothetical protein [Frankiaceae bacterium]
MTTTTARLLLAAALATSAYATAGTATAAAAPCSGYLSIYALNLPGYTNCMVDHVSTCTLGYDPLSPPFGQQVAPETVEYANCVV